MPVDDELRGREPEAGRERGGDGHGDQRDQRRRQPADDEDEQERDGEKSEGREHLMGLERAAQNIKRAASCTCRGGYAASDWPNVT